MKSKTNTKKPVAELEAVVSPSPELEMAVDRPEPALNKAEQMGADGYITKPFTSEELKDTMKKHLSAAKAGPKK